MHFFVEVELIHTYQCEPKLNTVGNVLRIITLPNWCTTHGLTNFLQPMVGSRFEGSQGRSDSFKIPILSQDDPRTRVLDWGFMVHVIVPF